MGGEPESQIGEGKLRSISILDLEWTEATACLELRVHDVSFLTTTKRNYTMAVTSSFFTTHFFSDVTH